MSISILKHTLPIYTTRSLKKKRSLTACVNNNLCNIMYTFNRKHFFPMPKMIKEGWGIPLRAQAKRLIPPRHQVVIDSGLSLELPSIIVGEVYSPWRQSHIKPWAAPGIIIPGHNNISVLLGNLTNQELKIK